MTTATAPTKVIVYARYSPRPDEATSQANAKQLADLQAYCERNSWPFDAALCFSDDALSGDDWERPGLWAAIREVEPGSVLLAYDIKRLARDSTILAFVIHQVTSREGTIQTLDNGAVTPDDPVSKFIFTVFGAIAELDKALIRKRCVAASKRKLSAGRFAGNHLPFGYRWRNREAGTVDPDPIEQQTLVVIRDLKARGKNRGAIAKWLNAANIPWRDGKPWNRFAVRSALGLARRGAKQVKVPKL